MAHCNLTVENLKNYLDHCGPNTRIYLGCDSERVLVGKKWYADYALAVVVHVNGSNGCKIFGSIVREADYDQRQSRPALRLMNEAYKAAQLYLELLPVIAPYAHEVHLDINPNEMYGSNCVVQQAIGYIRGTCNLTPQIKPRAFAASCAADRFKQIAAA